MAARTDAALPMACTGGFQALRKHVKNTRYSDAGTSASPPPYASRSEHEQESDGSKHIQPVECHHEARDNQERISNEERNLNLIRLSLVKEQREVKTRERSVKSLETALQEAMDRTAEKERSLDHRIQDIARLEQRLHEALSEHSPPVLDPQHHNDHPHPDDYALDEMRQKLEEREATLALREQELALARDRVADRDRHLLTKERVLRDKAAELIHLQTELEKKDTGRAALGDLRVAELEQVLKRQHETQGQVLLSRFQQQFAVLAAEFDAKQARLVEQVEVENAEAQKRWLRLSEREETLRQAEIAVAASQIHTNHQQKQLLVAQETVMLGDEDVASRISALDTQKAELARRMEDVQVMKQRCEEAAARLELRENKLSLFAAEVEMQFQFNAAQSQKLDADRAVLDHRVVAMSALSPAASTPTTPEAAILETQDDPTPTRDTIKPARTRRFTTGLFRSKSTTLSREA